MSDEKPKRTKSWREVDKGRDKSGARRSDDRSRENFEKTTGYTKYKANLDRLFSGGVALPDHLRDKLGGEEGGATDAEVEAKKVLFAIEDTKLFNAAATEYLKKHELPSDPRILDRLLSHPDEDILEQALTRLEELQKAGTLKAPPALKARLSSVEVDSGTPSVRRRAAELRKSLRG